MVCDYNLVLLLMLFTTKYQNLPAYRVIFLIYIKIGICKDKKSNFKMFSL